MAEASIDDDTIPLRRVDCGYYGSFAWRVRRAQVLARDNWRCQYCGYAARTADHIIPRRAGGGDEMENLAATCDGCNTAASDYGFPTLEARRAYVIEAREGLRVARSPKAHRPRLAIGGNICHDGIP
jgi:5-methylcytosine-specific restriction endonuclease McrA